MRRFGLAAGIVIALALCPALATAATAKKAPSAATPSAPPRTTAGPILAASDANDLAQNLNDATSTQGVCYGWDVKVDDSSGGPSGTDSGSSIDPNSDQSALQCKKYAILTASVTYESNSSDFDDSVSWGIDSNLPNPPTPADLKSLGVGGGGLLGDNNDTALINAVQALPLVVSSKGEAPAVPADLTPKPASSPDHPTNKPGADWLRQNTFLFVLALIVLGVGVYLVIHQYLMLRRDRMHYRHGEQVHEVLKDHTPEGVGHQPPPTEHKPSTVVDNWVQHIEESGANLPPDRKAAVLAQIEQAKENGSLALSAGQMRRIRKKLAPDEATKEAAADAPSEAAAPPTPEAPAEPEAPQQPPKQ